MNIYLDIDGVLLTREAQPAPHVEKLLRHVTSLYECYWLTTHCRDGQTEHLLEYLPSLLPASCGQYLERIKPTTWTTWKTEAIDFNHPFYWLDDNVFEYEKSKLVEANALSSLLLIDLRSDPDHLLKVINRI